MMDHRRRSVFPMIRDSVTLCAVMLTLDTENKRWTVTLRKEDEDDDGECGHFIFSEA